ncbi:uncharacterized protein LOC120327546 [Styela clava]|uniref:probable mitochondrial pyruvate carrier 2 n=1 Tax=Styela clava TaxID=7725 RepID=UPI0019395F1C|nr:probable mitochondrial pyruvate carrier 2 [Styela clava]
MASALRRLALRWDSRIQERLSPGWKSKWNHPAGPKTVHFWSPVVKWGLVIAGMSDFTRPVEALSLNQSLSLAVTGSIWARYCLVIIPKNYFLCSCNVFLGATGITQVARIMIHRSKQKDGELEADET